MTYTEHQKTLQAIQRRAKREALKSAIRGSSFSRLHYSLLRAFSPQITDVMVTGRTIICAAEGRRRQLQATRNYERLERLSEAHRKGMLKL